MRGVSLMLSLQLCRGDKTQHKVYDSECIREVCGVLLEIRPLHDSADDECSERECINPHCFTGVPRFTHNLPPYKLSYSEYCRYQYAYQCAYQF